MKRKINGLKLITTIIIFVLFTHIHNEMCDYNPEKNSSCLYDISFLSDEFLGD